MNAYQTDDPNQQVSDSIGEAARFQQTRWRSTLIIFAIIVVGLFLYSSFGGTGLGTGSIEVATDAKTLGVAGPNKTTHFTALSVITQVELIEDFDAGEAVEENGTDAIYVGTYENELLGEYEIIAYQSVPTVIAVYTEDSVFVFNGSSESATAKYYETVVEAVESYEAEE